MRVVVAAVPFGRLDSIPLRSRIEASLLELGVPYEVTQTALLLDPGAQASAFARGKPPYLYFLVPEADLARARAIIGQIEPHSLEV